MDVPIQRAAEPLNKIKLGRHTGIVPAEEAVYFQREYFRELPCQRRIVVYIISQAFRHYRHPLPIRGKSQQPVQRLGGGFLKCRYAVKAERAFLKRNALSGTACERYELFVLFV